MDKLSYRRHRDFAPHKVLLERCSIYRQLWTQQNRHVENQGHRLLVIPGSSGLAMRANSMPTKDAYGLRELLLRASRMPNPILPRCLEARRELAQIDLGALQAVCADAIVAFDHKSGSGNSVGFTLRTAVSKNSLTNCVTSPIELKVGASSGSCLPLGAQSIWRCHLPCPSLYAAAHWAYWPVWKNQCPGPTQRVCRVAWQ